MSGSWRTWLIALRLSLGGLGRLAERGLIARNRMAPCGASVIFGDALRSARPVSTSGPPGGSSRRTAGGALSPRAHRFSPFAAGPAAGGRRQSPGPSGYRPRRPPRRSGSAASTAPPRSGRHAMAVPASTRFPRTTGPRRRDQPGACAASPAAGTRGVCRRRKGAGVRDAGFLMKGCEISGLGRPNEGARGRPSPSPLMGEGLGWG